MSVHESIYEDLCLWSLAGRKPSAIVLGPDKYHELLNEQTRAKGFIAWHVLFGYEKDPEMFNTRILVSQVMGEISLI